MPLLNEKLLNMLVCPADKEKVQLDEKASVLKCPKCGRLYPVREGVPVMLLEEDWQRDSRQDARRG